MTTLTATAMLSVRLVPPKKCKRLAFVHWPIVNPWSFYYSVVQRRREEIRKQRIESEQRRRDELRDGYRRLKDVLPVSNQKSSKVSLLDRGRHALTPVRNVSSWFISFSNKPYQIPRNDAAPVTD